ncbi:class I SAM-dependent methyltransferase [Gloeobacter kilaueensis]|uniref:Methyltransferase n=1 Tax=Gloeobacter kilaueensis (strain ATCC BAA-2537 / CCAP 1431/1 / ULC 316 / JS1) TaxID=1183438 RepID=U5QIQ6_GLOK1|nr:class I SAM-dependent methyltransferase [Gloeobacter kilaueensis]AGY58773.1 methyltransferase [Gloeobacter kilaueensis JS1]
MDEHLSGRLRLPQQNYPAEAFFDSLAADYDRRYALSVVGRLQRGQVWQHVSGLFARGGSLVEFGCGTGIDAEYLAGGGLWVLATDPSNSMLALTAQRCAGLPQVRTCQLFAERVGELEEHFDGAFSNFAALNCVDDLAAFAAHLASKLPPGAPVAFCLFGRLCLWEMAAYAVCGRWAQAFRRLRPGLVAASIGDGQSISVRYHSARQVRQAFAPWFHLEGQRAIGLFVPPTYFDKWVRSLPGLLGVLDRLDRTIGHLWPFAFLGDHILYVLQRR